MRERTKLIPINDVLDGLRGLPEDEQNRIFEVFNINELQLLYSLYATERYKNINSALDRIKELLALHKALMALDGRILEIRGVSDGK